MPYGIRSQRCSFYFFQHSLSPDVHYAMNRKSASFKISYCKLILYHTIPSDLRQVEFIYYNTEGEKGWMQALGYLHPSFLFQ